MIEDIKGTILMDGDIRWVKRPDGTIVFGAMTPQGLVSLSVSSEFDKYRNDPKYKSYKLADDTIHMIEEISHARQ